MNNNSCRMDKHDNEVFRIAQVNDVQLPHMAYDERTVIMSPRVLPSICMAHLSSYFHSIDKSLMYYQ